MLKVGDCMKRNVISSLEDITVARAADIMISHHIGTLPIVNSKSLLAGLVRLQDLIILAMPDFVHMVENVDFFHDFGAVEKEKLDPKILNLRISNIMSEPVAVEENDGLVRAIALLQEHEMTDLPVVDEKMHLVGIASMTDIGVSLIANWTVAT